MARRRQVALIIALVIAAILSLLHIGNVDDHTVERTVFAESRGDADASFSDQGDGLVYEGMVYLSPGGIRVPVAHDPKVPKTEPEPDPLWSEPLYENCGSQLRDHTPPTGENAVEVVITWKNCANLDWLPRISSELSQALSVSILVIHKGAECVNEPPPSLPGRLAVVYFPTHCGDHIQSVFAYAGNVYQQAAVSTVFLSDDEYPFSGREKSAESIELVKHLISEAVRQKHNMLPIGAIPGEEPILFEDRESNVQTTIQDSGLPKNGLRQDHDQFDMFNQARDTYGAIFGTSPCKVLPGQLFYVRGFQFVVRKETFLKRDQAVWLSLANMLLTCAGSRHSLERLALPLFNGSRSVAPLEMWRLPSFCPDIADVDDGVPKYFGDTIRPNAFYMAQFWKKRWLCNPLSPFLQERLDADRLELPLEAEACTWSITYSIWITPEEDKAYESGTACLAKCCRDPACIGVLTHSTLYSQCFGFTRLPKQIADGGQASQLLSQFQASSPTKWSFFRKVSDSGDNSLDAEP